VTVVDSSPLVLVETKLHVPSVRRDYVSRQDLVARLLEGREHKLTLVCAPAGWGKTTVLAEWHASPEESRPFAWLSLDPADDDPVRFWGYVIGALRRVRPGLGEAPLSALPSARLALEDVVVAPLINELAAHSQPLVLVLDDYHLLRSDAVHDSLAYLLRHLPLGLQLAIASRGDPPLALAGLRAAGEITEIRAADLCFSHSEARELLNGSLALGLEPSDVELLRARTEGWAAGLQLAALSARAVEDRHAFVEALAGDDRQIGEYLHEVLAEQPPDLREFLLRTSVLERMSVPLCDAVTGRADAREQLEAVDRSNLFLVSLDSRREWFRYHHLFGELLRRELERAAPDLTLELHRRASAWHREHGNVDEAIAHATAAGDFDDAGELIARHWRPVWSLGQTETVAHWIDALPREAVLADARLCLARGWAALYLNLAECDRWRRAGQEAPLPAPFEDGTASVEEGAANLEAAHANLSGDVGGAIQAAQRALALAQTQDETTPGRAIASVHLGMAAYYAGELSTAEAAFETVLSSLEGDRWAAAIVTALGNLAAVRFDAGELRSAEQTAAEAERVIDDFHVHEAPFTCRYWIARGKLLEAADDLPTAEVAFERAAALARRVDSHLVVAHGLLALALLKRRRRAHDAARTLVREARSVLSTCRDPGVVSELLSSAERALQLAPARTPPRDLPGDPELSERELTVLRLLSTVLTQREIAAELYVSFNTVKTHVRGLFRKLGVATRADAVARGRELGLL
jgi:LuxR family maltose regulon positive regulatory protein